MKRLLEWLCKKFDFMPSVAIRKINDLSSVNSNLSDLVCQKRQEIDDVRAELQEATLLDKVKLDEINKALNLENDRLQKELENAEAYYKKVQEQVSEILHGDKTYGFNGHVAIPGATALTKSIVSDGSFSVKDGTETKYVTIHGRTLLLDTITTQIQADPSISGKYNIAYNQLLKYGIMDKIMQNLVSSGALQFTFGYNDDCTTIELYYTVEAKLYDQCIEFKSLAKHDDPLVVD